MMVNQEETIKSLQSEVLRLKLTCYDYERQLSAAGRKPGQDLDKTERELITDLMMANDELKNQLDDKNLNETLKEVEKVEVACQTNLDRYAIDRLIEDSLTLKKQKKLHAELSEQFQQVKNSLLYHQTIISQTQQQQQHLQQQQQFQQQQQQVQQQQQRQNMEHQTHMQQQRHHQATDMHHQQYQSQPSRPLQRQPTTSRDLQTTSSKTMTQDEKRVLEKLFKLNGLLTTARDKLRAAAAD